MKQNNHSLYSISSPTAALSHNLKRLVSVHPNYERSDHMTGYYYGHLTSSWLKTDELIDNVINSCDGLELNGENPATYCLLKTINEYGNMIEQAEKFNQTIPPHQKIKSFLVALIKEFIGTAYISVREQGSGDEWTTLDGTPLHSWINPELNYSINLESPTKETAYKAYELLVPRNIKIAMQRFEHENAIMDCILDNTIRIGSGDRVNTQPMDARCCR